MCLVRAAASMWLPVSVPFAIGPLAECSHCVANYLLYVPLVPGVLAAVLCGLDGVWFCVVAGMVTLVDIGVLALLLRELPKVLGYAMQIVVAGLVACEALAFASMLRM